MIIFLYSIVHTGTIFTQHLLASHPAIHFGTDLNGTIARTPINPLLDHMMRGRITPNQFETLIKVASVDRDRVVAGLDDPLSISTEDAPDWPHTILGCHIFERGHLDKTWPRDLFEKGFREFPIVTPLRDPVACLVSVLMGAGEDRPLAPHAWQAMDWQQASDYVFNAYQYLETLTQYGAFFLPLDLMGGKERSLQRMEAIHFFFNRLIGNQVVGHETYRLVVEWPRINVTTPDKYGKFRDPETIPRLLKVKECLALGEDPRGIDSTVDGFIANFRHTRPVSFLRTFGYEFPWA